MVNPSRHGFRSALAAAFAAWVLTGCGSAPRAPSGEAASVPPVLAAAEPAPPASAADAPALSMPVADAPGPAVEAVGAAVVPADSKPVPQRGIASWYGNPFHGRKTASGERYDMNLMTAAHPTLPLRSYVLVRHVGNQREVLLRVNDRGPFKWGRIIDLSRAAARLLGIDGIAQVEVWTVGADDPRVLAMKDAPGRREARAAAATREGKVVAVRLRRASDEPVRRSVSASAARRPVRSG